MFRTFKRSTTIHNNTKIFELIHNCKRYISVQKKKCFCNTSLNNINTLVFSMITRCFHRTQYSEKKVQWVFFKSSGFSENITVSSALKKITSLNMVCISVSNFSLRVVFPLILFCTNQMSHWQYINQKSFIRLEYENNEECYLLSMQIICIM